MWKFLFFFMGVPMILMSFFEAVDVLPYVQQVSLMVDGKEIVLTQEEQTKLQEQVNLMFENSRTMPAFGVMTEDMFKEHIQSGVFVSMKFAQVLEVNGLPFDELVFKVNPTAQGVDLIRGEKGVFQGRCIHLDLNENMQNMHNVIEEINSNHSQVEEVN